ncbi:vitelline membrane outer layer protein 1-like [Anolis carolinensis]|uniref:vitelline membrane outer layer protein 1-like n=1 Tax=Anolis carolinensis TaxID=28377 RepID=UPI002F2B2800
MDLSVTIAICLMFCCIWDAESRKSNGVLTVPNGAPGGTWGELQFCTSGHANGFAIKVQKPQGILKDDTSLNGIRLYCKSGETIESTVGLKGDWSKSIICSKGFLNSFSLNVEKPQGLLDDSAANNIKFKCQDGEELKGNSYEWGTFGPWSLSCETGAICGIQTRVQPDKTGVLGDDTGLNDVKFHCCD